MSWSRDLARKMMGHFRLPSPTTGTRTLHLKIQPGAVPSVRQQCLCHRVALLRWRVAHEHGCAKIVVHRDVHHRHAFDTVDLMRWHAGRLGVWPTRPRLIGGTMPLGIGTAYALSVGDHLDVTRPTVSVPVALVSTPSPVSGTAGSED